jgi:hypothetical protein
MVLFCQKKLGERLEKCRWPVQPGDPNWIFVLTHCQNLYNFRSQSWTSNPVTSPRQTDTRSETREVVTEKLFKNIDTCCQHHIKHQEPRGLGLCMELRINHPFQRNTAGSSCVAWLLNPVDTAHHSSQRTWRREQYSMWGIVRPQVEVQFYPRRLRNIISIYGAHHESSSGVTCDWTGGWTGTVQCTGMLLPLSD